MQKKVWKYKIDKSECQIPIPADVVKPLYVLTQRDRFGDGTYLWVELIPDKAMQSTPVYTFYGLQTGDDVPNGATYIGSCQDPKNNQIYHIYWNKPVTFLEEEEMEL